jgi:CheY-like chemotaxis protein
MNVLLVDDDSDDVEFFKEAAEIAEPNVKVIAVYTAREGLQFLARNSNSLPDFIFIDINMPVMTGVEFLELLHDKYDVKGTCIVMYTTSGSATEVNKCKSLGADYIVKPYSFDKLVQELTTAFAKAGTC